jgi:hypothetical protein
LDKKRGHRKGQLEEERKVSFQIFLGTEAEWADTEAVIFERVQAQELQLDIMTKQAHRLDTKGKKWRGIRVSFMALFTTSKMGLGTAHTRSGESLRISSGLLERT